MGKNMSGNYRGFKWISESDLLSKMGLPWSSLKKYRKENPDKTSLESFIDYYLDNLGNCPLVRTYKGSLRDMDFKEQRSGNYRGYSWNSFAELERMVGRGNGTARQFILKSPHDPDKAIEEYIDYSIDLYEKRTKYLNNSLENVESSKDPYCDMELVLDILLKRIDPLNMIKYICNHS